MIDISLINLCHDKNMIKTWLKMLGDDMKMKKIMQKVFLMKKVHYMPTFRQKTAIRRIGDILGIRPIQI